MIFDKAARMVVGNLGWVDHGSLWTFDLKSKTEGRVSVEGARYLTPRAGSNGLFCLVHHHSADQAVSVRRLAEPGHELASIRFDNGRPLFRGDVDLWQHIDPTVRIDTPMGQKLLLINATDTSVKELDLRWFRAEEYDLGYQGLADCMKVPQDDRVIVSVQRSSKLIVIDTSQNKVVDSIELCGRLGNPMLRMHKDTDFLASDYDTMCRVDLRSAAVSRSARLQGSAPGTQQFIGEYDIGLGSFAVARPFSGDVLLLDSETFKVRSRAEIGGQPLAVCLTSDASVVTREWKTGRVVIGQLKTSSLEWIFSAFTRFQRGKRPG